jgi:adenylosuccinate synthase
MDTVFAEDMLDRNVLRKKLALQYIRYELCGHPAQLSVERTADHLCALAYQIRIVHKPPRVTDHKYEYVVYEGSQGLLLDEKYGIPHTTWGDLTATNALALMREQEVTRNCSIGVTRAYSTRHGDGFLPEERETLGFVLANTSSYWQGPMRYGLLNTTMLAYAAYVANVALDVVAVTCLDHMRKTSTCMGMTSRPNTIHTVAKLCQVPCDRRENVLLACDHVDVLMRPHQQVDILQRLLGAQSALKSYGMVPDAIDGTLSNVTFRDVTCPCEPSSCVDFAVLDDIAAVKEEHGNAMATT